MGYASRDSAFAQQPTPKVPSSLGGGGEEVKLPSGLDTNSVPSSFKKLTDRSCRGRACIEGGDCCQLGTSMRPASRPLERAFSTRFHHQPEYGVDITRSGLPVYQSPFPQLPRL
jgi:hypothetical protein